MKKWIIVLAVAFAFGLAACGGGGGGSPAVPQQPAGTVNLACADARNDGQETICQGQAQAAQIGLLPLAVTINLDRGDVSRSELVLALSEVTNPTGKDIEGWIQMEFDAGCAGQPTWEILPKQQFVFPAGQTFSMEVGGQCGDMPLGARTLTATAWQPDGVSEIGKVIVSFNLVE